MLDLKRLDQGKLTRAVVFTILAVYFIVQIPNIFNLVIWNDEALYGWYSLKIMQSPSNLSMPIFYQWHFPLFSLLAVPLNLFFFPLISVRFLSLFFSLLGLLCIYLLAKKLYDTKTGIFSMIILGFSPIYFRLSTTGFLEVAVTALAILCALLLVKFLEAGKRKHFLALLASLAFIFLIKINGLFMAGAVVLSLIYFMVVGRDKKTEKKAIVVLLFFAALAIILINLILSTKYVWLLERLAEINLALSFTTTLSVFGWFFFCLVLLPFFIIGLADIKNRNSKVALLLIWIIVYALSAFLYGTYRLSSIMRYTLPALPAVVLISAAGLSKIRAVEGRQNTVVLAAVVCVVVLSAFYLTPHYFLFKDEIPFNKRTVPIFGDNWPDSFSSIVGFIDENVQPSDTFIDLRHNSYEFRVRWLIIEYALSRKGNTLMPLPEREEFESMAKDCKNQVYVSIEDSNVRSRADDPNHDWIFDLDVNAEQYLSGIGFEKIKQEEASDVFCFYAANATVCSREWMAYRIWKLKCRY